jgi:MoxR-vWA-beta-propeller ternary system domain bpX4
MAAFSEFLAQLLDEGKVVFRSAKVPQDRPTATDVATLGDAFATFALSVAGPPIEFDARTACEAAEIVRQASWALVNREERVEQLKRRLRMSAAPATPAQHLSADLVLRYLPQLLKRARGLDATDPLIQILGDLLRKWPLSGALSDVEEGPLVPPEFGMHSGLLLLYAERLAVHDRPAWRPEPSSPAHGYYQLVVGDRPSSNSRAR